jgi:DEAD/DEAH box helicase domain-containing protein
MIFLDIETKSWSDFMSFADAQISYMGVIDDDGKEIDFWEADLPKLKPILEKTDWIVGYNSIGFDLPIIGNYLGAEVNDLPQIDLMVAVYKTIGFRPKLDDLVTTTLGRSKIAKGSDAPIYWANGDLESLRKYGMEDVRLTKELYEFGKKNGYVKYTDKQGFVRQANINWDLGKKEKKVVEQTLSLF